MNSKFLSLEAMRLTTRICDPGKDNVLQKEKKQSFSRALTQAKKDPRAEEWLEKNKDLW